MRKGVLTLIAAALLAAGLVATASPSLARARVRTPAVVGEQIQDRYCLVGRSWGFPGNCQFSTYEQCMWTASGTGAGCNVNPRYAFARQRWGHRPGY